MNGCELCGDFPATLAPRCHPTAPVRIELHESGELRIYCYVPECSRHVATFRGLTNVPHGYLLTPAMPPPREQDARG